MAEHSTHYASETRMGSWRAIAALLFVALYC